MFSYGIRKLPFFHLLKYIRNICESFLGSLGMCVIGKGERRCFKGVDGNMETVLLMRTWALYSSCPVYYLCDLGQIT